MCFGWTVSPTVALWRFYIYFVGFKSSDRTLLRFGMTVDENFINQYLTKLSYTLSLSYVVGSFTNGHKYLQAQKWCENVKFRIAFVSLETRSLVITYKCYRMDIRRNLVSVWSSRCWDCCGTKVLRSLYRAGRFVFHFPPDFTPGRERPWPVFGAGLLPQWGSKSPSPWQPKMRPCPVLSEPPRHVLFHPFR